MTNAEGPHILEPVHAAGDEADGKRWSYRLVVFLRVMAAISLRFSERLITRFSVRATLLTGLTLVAAGLALFARAPVAGDYPIDVLPSALLIGTGVGVAFPALAALAMSDATPSDAGLASGLINTTTQVGAAVGLAVLATLSAARERVLVGRGDAAMTAAAGGYRLGFLVAAALVAVAVVIAVTVPRRTTGTPG